MVRLILILSLIGLIAAGCQDTPSEAQIPMPPAGSTYEVRFDSAQWTVPANGSELLTLSGFEDGAFLAIESASTEEVVLKLGVGAGDGQDFCSRTLIVPGASINSEREMNYGPTVLTLSNGTVIEEAHLRGTFSEGFTSLDNMRFSGKLDLDTFDPNLLPEIVADQADNLCELVEAVIKTTCVPCADGRVRCVESDVLQVTNPLREDMTLETVELADCHGKCQEKAEDCSL